MNLRLSRAIAYIALSFLGCARTLPRDGIYLIGPAGRPGKLLSITTPQGLRERVSISEYKLFAPERVLTYALPRGEGYQIQIEGFSGTPQWTGDPIAVVVDGSTYVELRRSASDAQSSQGPIKLPATMTLKVTSSSQAEQIKHALVKRYRLSEKERAN